MNDIVMGVLTIAAGVIGFMLVTRARQSQGVPKGTYSEGDDAVFVNLTRDDVGVVVPEGRPVPTHVTVAYADKLVEFRRDPREGKNDFIKVVVPR